jgi:Spy/CpxP family protein refolding chaperone
MNRHLALALIMAAAIPAAGYAQDSSFKVIKKPIVEPGWIAKAPVAKKNTQDQVVPSFEDKLFPPEFIMQHQRELELSAEQRKVITDAVKLLQNQATDLQWNLEAEQSTLMDLVSQRPIPEPAATAQLNKLLDLESAVKRAHLSALVHIKNALTNKQVMILNQMRIDGARVIIERE